MSSSERYTSFQTFWPFYLQEHSLPATRWVHFVGSSIVVGLVISALTVGPLWLLALTPVAGYGCAWFSHFVIEKNRPATFKYPLWSLAGDWKMWALMLVGRLQPELERLRITPRTSNAQPAAS